MAVAAAPALMALDRREPLTASEVQLYAEFEQPTWQNSSRREPRRPIGWADLRDRCSIEDMVEIERRLNSSMTDPEVLGKACVHLVETINRWTAVLTLRR